MNKEKRQARGIKALKRQGATYQGIGEFIQKRKQEEAFSIKKEKRGRKKWF